MTTKINTAALYENLIDRSLKFLPFWNLVSIIQLYIYIYYYYIFINFHITLDCKLLLIYIA